MSHSLLNAIDDSLRPWSVKRRAWSSVSRSTIHSHLSTSRVTHDATPPPLLARGLPGRVERRQRGDDHHGDGPADDVQPVMAGYIRLPISAVASPIPSAKEMSIPTRATAGSAPARGAPDHGTDDADQRPFQQEEAHDLAALHAESVPRNTPISRVRSKTAISIRFRIPMLAMITTMNPMTVVKLLGLQRLRHLRLRVCQDSTS